MFERYNIVDDRDVANAVDELAAYVDRQPTDPNVITLKRPRKSAESDGSRIGTVVQMPAREAKAVSE
jgi:hypothetical protein